MGSEEDGGGEGVNARRAQRSRATRRSTKRAHLQELLSDASVAALEKSDDVGQHLALEALGGQEATDAKRGREHRRRDARRLRRRCRIRIDATTRQHGAQFVEQDRENLLRARCGRKRDDRRRIGEDVVQEAHDFLRALQRDLFEEEAALHEGVADEVRRVDDALRVEAPRRTGASLVFEAQDDCRDGLRRLRSAPGKLPHVIDQHAERPRVECPRPAALPPLPRRVLRGAVAARLRLDVVPDEGGGKAVLQRGEEV